MRGAGATVRGRKGTGRYAATAAALRALVVAVLAWPNAAQARQAPADTASCSCAAALEELARTVETGYAGFVMDVRPNRPAAYAAELARARAEAGATSPEDCLPVLQRFVTFFQDGHVFVATYPRLTQADSARLAENVRTVDVDEAALRARWIEAAAALDPIEGLWYDADGLRAAVVPDPDGPAGSFVAVHLQGQAGWRRGDVKAEFRRLTDGSYDVTYFGDAHEPLHPHVYMPGYEGGGVLRRASTLLHMPPYTWGRLLPVPADLAGGLDPLDPRAPTARVLGDSVVILSVPSHSPQHRARLENLVDRYALALRRARLLVIDLRGNEGGSAGTTNVLLPYLVSTDVRTDRTRPDGAAGILASPGNVRWIERSVSQGWIPEGLLDRMRAHPGEIVAFDDPPPPDADPEPESDTEPVVPAPGGPSHVAVLVDRGVVSAGEAFLLRILPSTRVTLVGAASGGTIDYQTVSIQRFGCPALDLAVGLPVFAGSLALPEGGINPTGIRPDLAIDPDRRPLEAILDAWRAGRLR